jgi:hypothetical protein
MDWASLRPPTGTLRAKSFRRHKSSSKFLSSTGQPPSEGQRLCKARSQSPPLLLSRQAPSVADKDKVPSDGWRVVFAVFVAAVVVAFVGAGIFALEATSKIKDWWDANDEGRLAKRARLDFAAAQMDRANELLVAYGENEALAAWKIERTSLAAGWFRVALALLVGLALLFIIYAVSAAFFG